MLSQIKIQDVIDIAREAGNVIMQIYKQDFTVEYKGDNSPLTLADKQANQVIKDGLDRLPVNFPVLSEEGDDIPYETRRNWEYFWLVDPLDGTKEFISKNDEFTVNIALVHKGRPILGVVYAPALKICYWAKQGEGAFKDGEALPLKSGEQCDTYSIVVSRSHMSKATVKFVSDIDTDKKKEMISIGSSLKICLIAEGKADIYPRLSGTMEWDTAAAHAIANEAEVLFCGYINGQYVPHKYNKENLLNDWFVVSKVKTI